MTASTHPFLTGNYAPVRDEITVDALEIEGTVPDTLQGTYLRTGPNPYADPGEHYHWFLGDGMIHAFDLRAGRASYRNRWVRTSAITNQTGEPAVPGPAQPMYDSSNTNVLAFRGHILSLTEGAYPYEMSRELETLKRVGFGGELPHGLTAHPKIDPVTGELHAFSYWWDTPFLIYHVIDAQGRLQVTEPIELPAPVSMHDFAITRNHVLFFDQPAVFDLDLAMKGSFPYSWKPENGARVGVLPRGGTNADVRWYETPLGYTFHPMNAYEERNGTIVVDVPWTPHVYTDARKIVGATASEENLQRWIIDPSKASVDAKVLDAAPQDFCRINESLLGARHRFGYCASVGESQPYDDTRVYKHDFDKGTRETHDYGAGRHPGEVVFVADPARAEAEDGGWLVGLVHDETRDRTSLVILDAQRVADEPVAQVHGPRRVPYGFHGNWVPYAG
jgi:carotenoid cleavage dioxygenase